MIQTAGGTATNNVNRSWGNFPDNTGDWTVFIRFKWSTTPASYISLLNLFQGTPNFTGPYIFLGSLAATDNLVLETLSGDTSTFAITHNTQYWAAITYKESTHTLTLIVSGTTVGTLVTDLSAVVWDKLYLLGDGGLSPANAASVAYCRAWNRILIAAELIAESISITATSTVGLIWDNPLQASIDLTSHNNTLNQLTASGTITTDTSDPLLSIVAGPPTNVDPANAMTITTDSAIFQDTLTAGAATNVWHKYTAQNGDTAIGACSFGDLITYKPTVEVFEGLANANNAVLFLNIPGNTNRPIQFPVTAGLDYYLKTTRNGAITPATLQISVLKGLDLPAPVGSIAVNDDNSGFPLVLLDNTTGYPIKFINNFAAGEGADVVPVVGNVLVSDIDSIGGNPNVKLYSLNYQTVLATILPGDQVNSRVSFNNNKFLISLDRPAVNSVLRLADVNGVLDPTVFDLGTTSGPTAIALNADATLGYYVAAFTTNLPVKTWNLVTNTTAANLVAGIANFNVTKNMLVLSDSKIVVPYAKGSATQDFKILVYDTTGATLHTYDFGAGLSNNDNQVAQAIDNPNSFWVWMKHSDASSGLSVFSNIKVSDGSILSTRTASQFEVGTYQQTANNTPDRFGHSESCPFWITRVAIGSVANPGGGIYILTGTSTPNPRQNHDTIWVDSGAGTTQDLAIPNPTFESYLAGDE